MIKAQKNAKFVTLRGLAEGEHNERDAVKRSVSRRGFLKTGLGAAAAIGFPTIVPPAVLGQFAPSKRINIGAIGVGRISRVHDMPIDYCSMTGQGSSQSAIWMRIAWRMARSSSTTIYAKKTGKPYDGVTGYANYHELLANKDIDAVVVSTPDHWHALIGVDAVRAGKDVYLQKPASLTIAEGRALSNAVQASGRILQIGSQQRSTVQFRYAAELVRNGRIGDISVWRWDCRAIPPVATRRLCRCRTGSTMRCGWAKRPMCTTRWTGCIRKQGYDRPGWLRCRQFGAGMITGWGAHHIDSAHWGMNTEYTGPIEVWGHAEFPDHGLWDVHGPFKTEALAMPNGVQMSVSGDYPNGIKFYGTKGWIFVSRGNEQVTKSDPVAKLNDATALASSDPKIIKSVIGPDEIHLYESKEQHGNWLDCIISRKQPDLSGGDGASRMFDLPDSRYGDGAEAQALLGSDEGTFQERR